MKVEFQITVLNLEKTKISSFLIDPITSGFIYWHEELETKCLTTNLPQRISPAEIFALGIRFEDWRSYRSKQRRFILLYLDEDHKVYIHMEMVKEGYVYLVDQWDYFELYRGSQT